MACMCCYMVPGAHCSELVNIVAWVRHYYPCLSPPDTYRCILWLFPSSRPLTHLDLAAAIVCLLDQRAVPACLQQLLLNPVH